MRKTIAVCMAICAMNVAACNTLDNLTQPPSTVNTIKDEKALYVAEAAYQGIGSIMLSAVNAGLLKGDKAAQARVLNQEAYSALLAARAAQAAGQATTYETKAAAVLDLVARIQALIRKP